MKFDTLKSICESYWRVAQSKFPVLVDYDLPPIVINPRLRTTAGRCFYQRTIDGLICTKIDFNKTLLEANENYFIADTIPHELAHAIDNIVFNSKGHTDSWRACFAAITNGKIPQRCHSMPVESRKVSKPKTTTMRCDCKEWEFTPQRMAWVKKGKVYFCPTCKSNIVRV